MNTFIKLLATKPRLNFWLGPGCSAGLSYWNESEILAELQRRHPKLAGEATLEDAFFMLDPLQRETFVASTFNAMNWAYLSLAKMIAKNRVGAIVLRNIDGLLPRLLASHDLLPPLLRELDDSSESIEASTSMIFDLPVIVEPERWRDLIIHAGAGNPWVVAGVTKPLLNEIALLKEISATGTPIHFVTLWAGSKPANMPGQTISGFDPDSFFAGLAQESVGFSPSGFNTALKPEEALQKALCEERESLRNFGNQFLPNSNQELSSIDDVAFLERLNQMRIARMKMERISPNCRLTGGMEYLQAANNTGGRRADALLAAAEAQHPSKAARTENFAVSVHKGELVKILHSRAKLRRPVAAEPFYEAAYRAILSLPPKEPRQWQVAIQIAPMLHDWAATKQLEEADRLMREAIEILHRPLTNGPIQGFEEAVLWQVQTTILRQHALRHEGMRAREVFAEAIGCVERLSSLGDRFMSEYLLGMIALERARKDREAQDELIAEATAHFLAALPLKESSRGLLIFDWGTAIATIGRERNGSEADALFAQAYTHYASVAEDPTASSSVHNNWASFLLVQARKKQGAEREKLLAESWIHANKTEKLNPAKGAYNLACIAAERADWETMSKWLHISARSPIFPAPAHTDSVTSFDPIRNEVWFQKLLGELYP